MTKSGSFGKNASDSATVLDYSILLAVVDGDDDLLRSICGLFLKNYPVLMSGIHEAIARNNSTELVRAAHTLKGSGGYFLTDSARKTLVDLERMAREGDLRNAGERFAELESEMERLKPEVLKLATEGLPAQED
jgi:two-component system, sensor histidine kinase and response regulator